MKSKKVKNSSIFLPAFFLSFIFFLPRSFTEPAASAKTSPEKRITLPVRDEVKILRKERRNKMPYLDKGYVKETINSKAVKSREIFAQKGSKTLNDLMERSLQVYTPAKAAKERVSLSRRRILVAGRELMPGAEFNFEFKKGSLSSDAFEGKNRHFVFKVPVFRGGILWNTFLQEKAQYQAAKKEYDAIVNQMVMELSSAYFEFNRAREVYETKKGLAEKTEKQHTFSKKKFEQGLVSEIEYLNVESLAGQLQYDVETAKQELELSKLELQRFLGVDNIDELAIASLYNRESLVKSEDTATREKKGPATPEILLGKSLDEVTDLAYRNRPELQVEAAKLRAARFAEKVSGGGLLPRMDLTMEFGKLAEAFTRNSLDPPLRHEWRLGFELSDNFLGNKTKYTFEDDQNAPSVSQFLQGSGSRVKRRGMTIGLLDGLQAYAELKESEVKKLEQVIELEKKEQEVVRDVKEAYFDYQKARIQVESSLKRNQYRERLVQLALARLDKAEIEISEYLQAELDLAEERSRLDRALADLFKARSKLNRATGIPNFLPVEERYGL